MSHSIRKSSISRKTLETKVDISLNIDGTGKSNINTKIPFFDHMLSLFSKHGCFDLNIEADGDIEIDFHHTVEDVGIVLGECFREALGEKKGIVRYASGFFPMDESLVRVALDIGGRSYLDYRCPEQVLPIVDKFNFSLIEEFFRAFTFNSFCNLHLSIMYGRDSHHMAEALFKGVSRCVATATSIDPKNLNNLPSTKGVL